MRRREFLAGAAGLALGSAFWEQALRARARAAASSYGALRAADANGLRLPPGFSSRLIARSGQPVPQRTRLAGGPSPEDGGQHVELLRRVGDLKRLGDDHPQRLTGKVILERAPIDGDPPRARPDPDPGHGCLAAPGAVEALDDGCHYRWPAASGSGRWAWCGWALPR